MTDITQAGPAIGAPERSIRGLHQRALEDILRTVVVAILLTRAFGDPLLAYSEVSVGGSTMGLGAAVNLLVIAVAAVLVLLRGGADRTMVFGVWTPFLAVAFAAMLNAPELVPAAKAFVVTTSYWAMFVIPILLFRRREDLVRFMRLVMLSAIVPALYSFTQIWEWRAFLSDYRVPGTFAHPNIFSFYLVLLIGVGLYIATSRAVAWPRRTRQWAMWAIPVLLLLLVLTKTRSAWIACALLLIVHAVWFDRRFLLVFLAVPVLVLIDPSLLDRVVELGGHTEVDDYSQLSSEVVLNSFEWRQILWQSALPWIADKPLFGHGLESFRPSTALFFPVFMENGQIDAHNYFLQVAFEMGVVGLIALAWQWTAISWRIARGARFDKAGIVIVACLMLGYLLESFSDNMSGYLSFNWYFWFALGTVCAWVRHRSSCAPG
jgi:O-antigen ligase